MTQLHRSFSPLPEKDASFKILELERKNLTHTHHACSWRKRSDGLLEHRCVEDNHVYVISKRGRRVKGATLEAFR